MAINVSVQYNGGLFPTLYCRPNVTTLLGNPLKCHEDVSFFVRTISVGEGFCQTMTFSYLIFPLFSRPRAGLATV